MSFVLFDIILQKCFPSILVPNNQLFCFKGFDLIMLQLVLEKLICQRFEAKTSLLPAARFLIESVQRYPCEPCQICRQVLILTSSLQYWFPFYSTFLFYIIFVFIPPCNPFGVNTTAYVSIHALMFLSLTLKYPLLFPRMNHIH